MKMLTRISLFVAIVSSAAAVSTVFAKPSPADAIINSNIAITVSEPNGANMSFICVMKAGPCTQKATSEVSYIQKVMEGQHGGLSLTPGAVETGIKLTLIDGIVQLTETPQKAVKSLKLKGLTADGRTHEVHGYEASTCQASIQLVFNVPLRLCGNTVLAKK